MKIMLPWKVNQYPNGLAVLYLSAPEAKKMVSTAVKEPPVKNSGVGAEEKYQYAALSVSSVGDLLFTAEEIRHWQTDPAPS